MNQDRQEKLDFIAQSISRAKQVMDKVHEKYDRNSTTGNNTKQPGRRSYSEADYTTQADNTAQYLSPEQLMEIQNSRMGAESYAQAPGLPPNFAQPQQQRPVMQQPQLPAGRYPREITSENYNMYDDPTDRERPLPFPDASQYQSQINQHMGQPQPQQPQYRPYKNLNSSKMPKEILESFLQKPMIDPTQPIGMEQLFQKVAQPPQQQQPQQYQQPIPQYQPPAQPYYAPQPAPINESVAPSSGMDIKLLEYVIKKTVEETLKQVSKQTNINENIQIKIGDQTFGGTIKTLKKIATTTKK